MGAPGQSFWERSRGAGSGAHGREAAWISALGATCFGGGFGGRDRLRFDFRRRGVTEVVGRRRVLFDAWRTGGRAGRSGLGARSGLLGFDLGP